MPTRIHRDPAIMGGKPVIRDTRVTVGAVLSLFAEGASAEEILADYPYLEPADLLAVLQFVAAKYWEWERGEISPALEKE